MKSITSKAAEWIVLKVPGNIGNLWIIAVFADAKTCLMNDLISKLS